MHVRSDSRRIGALRSAGPRARKLGGLLAVLTGLLAAAAPAAQAGPVWRVTALANTTAAPGAGLVVHVEVRNVGDADADSSVDPIILTGTLPAGLRIASAVSENAPWDCSSIVVGQQTFSCERSGNVSTGASDFQALTVETTVDGNASGVLTSRFDIRGGGAQAARTVAPATITTAPPHFGIAAFDAQVTADAAGTPFTQAGGHPFAATTSIDFNTFRHPDPLKSDLTAVEAVKDVEVDLPAGFSGDLTGVEQCTLPQLSNSQSIAATPLCTPSSQVGTILVRFNGGLGSPLGFGPFPVFNMVPPVDAPARFGFNVAGTVVTLDVTARTATDYGLTAHLRNISEGLATAGATVTLWGVPADPVHDFERACAGQVGPAQNGPHCTSSAARTALLRNPTSCPDPGLGLPTTLRMDSWVHPGIFVQQTIFSHIQDGYPFAPASWGPQQGTTGCAAVPFDPRLAVTPATTASAQPSGYAFDISLPQTNDPLVIGQSDLRKAVVTLPLGVRFNTSAAAGLDGCSPAQVALHTEADAACPPGSKLGSVTLKTPAIRDPLEGSVYLAGPHDNPFDTLIALYIVARGSGLTVKLAGRVDLDQVTGQVTATFDDNPQQPVSNVHIAFDGGPRASLANPLACGTYVTNAELTGWSGKVVNTDSSFTVSKDGKGAPCGAPKFSPTFAAGTESSSAGTSSPFHVRFTRADDDQDLGGLRLNMPPGLLGRIADVPLCGAAQANAGTCSDRSKIGSVTVGAGSGPNPFYITDGRLYLTGPYKGAPFGLSVVVPAVAGPFNLGNVVVRQSIFVDKHTSALRIVSDPLPTLLQGITLGVRDVRVAIDKPRFFLNPTNCIEKRIAGQIDSASGQSAAVSDRFEAADCRGLSFTPRMALSVGGRGNTARGRTTPFSTTLTMPKGDANLRSVRVTLPTTLNARLTVINDACTRAEFERGNCAHARTGIATAVTPLLRDPLHGNVYFVKNGHPLPDLFVALRGQVDFDLIGRITIPGSKRLRTTFDAVPDVPVRSFKLQLFGDPRNGSIGAATNLCSAKGRGSKVELDYVGQSGKVSEVDQALRVNGCGQAHKAGHGRAKGSRR